MGEESAPSEEENHQVGSTVSVSSLGKQRVNNRPAPGGDRQYQADFRGCDSPGLQPDRPERHQDANDREYRGIKQRNPECHRRKFRFDCGGVQSQHRG